MQPQHYQQPLDITVGEHELVYFVANGTHDIFLTGNYVLPPDFSDEDSEDDYDDEGMDYDLSPDEDELDGASDSEEDELDGLADPRVTEVDSDEEEAPKLVAAKKGKNKRAAESEDEANLDDLISKATKGDAAVTNGDEKLSKKQAKKLKKNDGQAAAAASQEAAKKEKEAPNSDKKKVQFAKNLEQGPTGSPKVDEPKKEVQKTSIKVVSGVTVDDKKVGKGKAAKKGDRVEMRYIGKLKSGKQFDG
jgi:FK506-binding nuclear protein